MSKRELSSLHLIAVGLFAALLVLIAIPWIEMKEEERVINQLEQER